MIFSTATVPVNPPGEPPLTREQVWRALVLKARDARQFLPPGACTRCEVIDEGEGFIVREATISGSSLKEIVTFEPQAKVTFHQFTGPREGAIVNQIVDGPNGALQLKFYCLLAVRDAEPDGPEEQADKERFNSEDRGYKRALLTTLDRARVLAAGGEL